MSQTYNTYAKKNGFLTGYNLYITKDHAREADRFHWGKFPVVCCLECNRCIHIRQSHGKGFGTNRFNKPKYLPDGFPTIGKDRVLCGVDKCYNKLKEK